MVSNDHQVGADDMCNEFEAWAAVVYLDRKKVRLGRYDTPEEAAIAAQCYREKHGFKVCHGEL